MPRSSRHKSHKHSSKDAREHSLSEEDGRLKDRKGREESDVRVSRDSALREKRKLLLQSQDGEDLFGCGNGDLSEEYVASKRRKDKADAAVRNRRNSGEDERGEGLVSDKETKGEASRPDFEKGPKSKVLVDSKSKSSRRNDSLGERKEKILGLDESKNSSSKVELKLKSEKDTGRKEIHQDAKDKERTAERSRKGQDVRRERPIETVPGMGVVGGEVNRKQESQSGVFEDDGPVKPGTRKTERQIHNELQNPELEKELEKRIRRRTDGSCNKDKYQDDVRDSSDRRLSSRDDRAKDERHKDGRYRDKYIEDVDGDNRHRDDKHRNESSSRDHTSDRSDTKHLRDENKTAKIQSKPQDSDRGGSPHLEERSTRYKDNKGRKRSSVDNDDHSYIKSRSTKEHRSDVERKSLRSSKVESVADTGRSQSHHADAESNARNRRSSPSSSSHVAKDQYRHPKQTESKYKDTVSEERVQRDAPSTKELTGISGAPERASESQSVVKPIQKDGNHLGELSAERSPRSDDPASPMQLMDKSPSSSYMDRRYSSRTSVRHSLNVEEMGRRSSGSKDARYYSANEDRVSRESPLEKPPVDEFSQADGDTVSVSSSFNRPSNSSPLLPSPPPFRVGFDLPSVFGSSGEDSKGKSTNRYKRSGDPNVGRGQGNAWKGFPNWHSPLPNGFIPFQHGAPPGGFHAVMQQFPVPPLFGVRPSMELNHTGVPYHIPNADRFSSHGPTFGWRNSADDLSSPHFHGWDGSNGVFGDESHISGRLDGDQNRHLVSGRDWETSADMWKGQNGGLEMPSAVQKEIYPVRTPADEVWAGQLGRRSLNVRNRPGNRAESIEINLSSSTPRAKDTSEAPAITIHEKTHEPSKISSDDDPPFFNVYLSQLDISADLTRPELYKLCMSSLDKKQNTTINADVTKHVHVEEGAETGATIFNSTWRASPFPTIKESVFQRAMTLYKKQSEEMEAILPISSFHRSELEKMPVSDGEKLELVPTSNREKVEEPVPVFNAEKAEVLVPISDEEITEEAVPTSDQDKQEELVPAYDKEKAEGLILTPGQKVEDPVPTFGQENAEEPVPTFGHEKPGESVPTIDLEKPGEPVPISNQEKVEVVTTSYQEKLEDAVEDRILSIENASWGATNSPSNDEEMNRASDAEGNLSANSPEVLHIFGDTRCGPLLFSDVSSEACEALMPESIDSKSVNLSRIHHSPESTH